MLELLDHEMIVVGPDGARRRIPLKLVPVCRADSGREFLQQRFVLVRTQTRYLVLIFVERE